MSTSLVKCAGVASILLLVARTSIAANDWTKPCLSGWCSWDTGDGTKTAFSSLVVNGGSSGLSDITTAAGWNITGCNSDWSKGDHDVTITCTEPATCNHLFNGGAPNTVVRLPAACGKGPFAVMKTCKAADGKDKRSTTLSKGQKWDATLTFDFATIPHDSDKGPINMFLTSSNIKAPQIDKRWAEELLRKRGRDAYLHKRGFFDNIGNAIKGGADQVANKVTQAAGAVQTAGQNAADAAKKAADDAKKASEDAAKKAADQAKQAADQAKTAAQAVATAAKKIDTFNKSDKQNLKPITVKKNFPIFDKSITCGTTTADLNMNVDATLNAKIAFAYTIIGTAVPPKLDEFNVQANLNGDVAGTFNINMALQGTFDTGIINLFKAGLPGLSLPGIAEIGPEFTIGSELTANMNIEAQMAVNTAFQLPNVDLVFPPPKGKSSAAGTKITPAKQPLKVSAGSANATGTGTLDAHLIPRFDFGVDILNGFAKATVFLQVDASGTLSMEVDAARTVKPKREEASRFYRRADATKSISGQVALDGSVFIDGGLDGALGNLFSKSIDIPIFQFTKNILTKTFGTPAAKREEIEGRALKKAKPSKAGALKQSLKLNCFGSGSLLGLVPGAKALPGFLSPLAALPI